MSRQAGAPPRANNTFGRSSTLLMKYGLGLSLLGIVPTVIAFWLWIL